MHYKLDLTVSAVFYCSLISFYVGPNAGAIVTCLTWLSWLDLNETESCGGVYFNIELHWFLLPVQLYVESLQSASGIFSDQELISYRYSSCSSSSSSSSSWSVLFQEAIISNRTWMKFGRIVPQVNLHFCIDWWSHISDVTSYFRDGRRDVISQKA